MRDFAARTGREEILPPTPFPGFPENPRIGVTSSAYTVQDRVDSAAVERIIRAERFQRSIPLKPRRRDFHLGAFLIDARRATTAPGERIATHTTCERGGQPRFRRFCPRPMFFANADRAAA